jgi:hypothetical protein
LIQKNPDFFCQKFVFRTKLTAYIHTYIHCKHSTFLRIRENVVNCLHNCVCAKKILIVIETFWLSALFVDWRNVVGRKFKWNFERQIIKNAFLMLTQKRLFEKSVIKTINVFLDSEKKFEKHIKSSWQSH